MELVRQKNVATYVVFPLVDADGDLVTGASSLDSEIDQFADGSAPNGFADCTNEATEIGSTGIYYLSLTQGEMNNDYIVIQIKSASSKTQVLLISTMVGDPLNFATSDDGGAFNVAAGVVEAQVKSIDANAITATAIASDAIAATKIATGAITAAKFAAGAIDAAAIADNAIDAGAIAADAIAATKIATGAITAAKFAAGAIDAAAIADAAIDAATFAAGAITAAAIANGAIDAATFAADVDAEILSYIVDDATRIDASALNTAAVTTIPAILEDTGTTLQAEVDGIQADTEDIQSRLPAALTANGNIKADTLRVGGTVQTAGDIPAMITAVDDYVDSEVAAIKTVVDAIQAVTDELPDAGALTSLATQASVNTIDDFLDTEVAAILAAVDTEVAAIKAKTDKLPEGISKNVALANFGFLMVDAANHVSGMTGLTVTAERSIDGGAFAACANSPAEVGSGYYKIALEAADLNGTIIALKFSAVGADDTVITFKTEDA